ncbi:MAG: hypothetical protein ABIO95_12530 [Bdellovibrionota bacterium]
MRCSRHEFAAAPAGAIKMSDDGKIFAFAYDRALYIQDKSTSVQKTFVIGGSSTRLHKIVSLAVDAANREIFVMTSEPTEILAFPIETEGNVAPLRVIDNPALSGSIALSLDPVHNELFVVRSQSSSIQVLKRLANNQGPRSIFSQDVQRTIQVETNPRGIAYLSKLDQVAVVLENGHIVLHNRVLEPSKNSSISVTEASNAFVVVSASSKIEWLNRDGSVGEKSF